MKKKFKSFTSVFLAAALTLGTIPALNLNAAAAESGTSMTYTQALDKATTIEAKTAGDSAELADVNKNSGDWEHSPSGKALSITANSGEVRVFLPAFGDGIEAAVNTVSTNDVMGASVSGNNEPAVTAQSVNPGPADAVYEISMRTGDTLYGSVGFLARYKDENHYAGLTIDFDLAAGKFKGVCQYSTGNNGRQNPNFPNAAGIADMKPNTDYLIELTCNGTVISSRFMEQGSSQYTDLGSYTISEGNYYTGPGGLAIRLNPGTGSTIVGGKTVVIDNIVQKTLDGTVIRSMNFDDGVSPEFKAFANKGQAENPSLATLALVDITAGEKVAGFGEETVNKLTSNGGIFVDEMSPETDNGIYTVKLNGSTANYGLVFNYKDADNYAAVRFDGSAWVVEGKKEGAAVTGIALLEQPAALTAGEAHTLVLDYSDLKEVTLKVDDAKAAKLGDLSAAFPAAGRVGLCLGEAGTLYTGAVQLSYTKVKEPEIYDPGLPAITVQEGEDSYTQVFTGGQSTLAKDGVSVPSITVNQSPFGMVDKALSLKAADDHRVNLPYFKDGPADGSYEFAFRTGDNFSYTSIGFLARYVDESQYVGFSIDGGEWQIHAATSLSTRQNNPFPEQYETLTANTTYKVKLSFVGTQVSLEVMKEGDSDYTNLGTLTTLGHIGGGGFAVRMRTASELLLDNIVQYDASGREMKRLDFDDGKVPDFEVRRNKDNTIDNNNAMLKIKDGYPTEETVPGVTPGPVSMIEASEKGIYIDAISPIASLGTMTVQLKGTSSNYGIVFNYRDNDNYATIEYDGTKWIAGGKNGSAPVSIDLSGANIPAIAPNDTRTLRLIYDAMNGYSLSISGGPGSKAEDYKTYSLGKLDGLYTGDGRQGVIVNKAMTLYAGPINMVYVLKAVQFPIPAKNVITLKSDQMQVMVGNSFPHIYVYLNQNGEYLTGTGLLEGEENTGMTILTKDGLMSCTTTSELTAQTQDSATYSITAKGEGIEAVFTAVLKITDNTMALNITDVKQITGTVRTFSFDDLPMVAIAGRTAGAALGFVNDWGPSTDSFISLKSSVKDTVHKNMTYALFYDTMSGVVAAVENNAEKGEDKYRVAQNSAYPYLSASNTAWAWQYYDNSIPSKNMPYAKVVVAGDENGDGEITWQDAGIAYRDIMIKAYGSENTKNEWMYIAMNMSSGASQPFLRVLDEAKAISYLTDGFGMKIMNKGYQGSGHDDSHGDYDFVGVQQGGLDDFNTLIDEGLKYGIKNGVHINATEFALDGYETKLDNLRRSSGELIGAWGWFDKAFSVDKSIEIQTGDLERRLDEFEEAAPNLDFFYVDVYQSGSGFDATEFMRYMNENGACVGTEALGDFNQLINFVHWNTDLNYSVGSAQGEVIKFVMHGLGDLAAPDRALLGSLMPGVADWRNVNDFNDGERVFYRNNLPTKYLQYFELLDWTPNESATLSGKVRTEVKEEGGIQYTYIYKDDKVIARIDTSTVKLYGVGGYPAEPRAAEIFIPWSPVVEDKIYCYNDFNTTKTWDLPASWKDVKQACLYPLTENGRDEANMKVVPVVNGQVQLTLELSSPYILVKQEEERAHRYNSDGTVMKENGETVLLPTLAESEWGYGSPIKNFGFSGKTFEGWTKNAVEGSIDDIVIDNTITRIKGNPRAMFKESVAGSLSQVIDVEPGKTYSISAWTMAEGERSPKITVKAGDEIQEASVLTTYGIPITMRPSKYNGMNYQRLKVNITIPEGVTQAEITFSAEKGDKPVYVDDFRCWEWLTAPNPKADNYYYFEDFENVDENWGPFISQCTNQPFIHLSYKEPANEGKQIKYYTVDTYNEDGTLDTTNLTSLKGRQSASYSNGIMMRTLPSTVDFKKGATYLVELDHNTYLEETYAIDGHHVGYNYPLTAPLYYMDVRSADGTIIKSYPLTPSSFTEESIDARPSTEKLSITVDATNESGIYLTLRRDLSIYQKDPKDPSQSDSRPAFAIDNFRVSIVSETGKEKVTFTTTPDNAKIVVKDADGQTVEAAYGKTYFLEAGTYHYTVSADGYVTKEADFTVSEEASITVELEKEVVKPVTYNVTFNTTPANASVTVKDGNGNVIAPAQDKTYVLEEGTYHYTVSADGYISKGADFAVSKEASITVELEKEDVKPETYSVTFTTTPADATVTVKDADGNVVAPKEGKTYALTAGNYTYTVSADGYVSKTAALTVKGEEALTVTLEKTVTPSTDESQDQGGNGNDDSNDSGSNDNSQGTDSGIKAPVTGDPVNTTVILMVIFLFVAACGIGAVVLVRGRRDDSE